MESQSNNIPDVVKTDEKGQRFAESTCISDVERESISKSRFARKAESKSRRTVNLFNQWLRNSQGNYGHRKDIFEKPKGFCWPWKSKLLIVCFHNWVSQRKWWGIPWQHPLWYYISIKTDFVRMEDMWPWWMILNLKECGKCYIKKKWKIKFFCYWNWEKAVGDYIRGWWRWYVGKEYTWHRYKWETLCFCLNLNLLCGEGPKGRYGENSQLKLGKEKDFWNIERMFRNVILVELIIGDWKVSRLFKHIKTWRHQTDELF